MKLTFSVVLPLVLAAPLLAQSPQSSSADKLQAFSLDFTYASKFVYRGIQYNESVFHPSLEYSNSHFYAGYWGGYPVRTDIGEPTHHIFYAGGNQTFEKLTLDGGVMQYHYSNQPDSTEVFVGIAPKPSRFNTVMPGAYAYYNFDTKTLTTQGSADYAFRIPNVPFPINLGGTIGGVISDKSSDYVYYGVSATAPFQWKRTLITAGLHYASNDLSGAKRDRVFFSVGLLLR